MKIFGIGLPRTGTTSLSMAVMNLGFKTCHVCLLDSTYYRADAFFDTPIWANYKELDERFPGSKFILSWRDPEKWYQSFSKNIGSYLNALRNSWIRRLDVVQRRAYLKIFGPSGSDKEYLISCYIRHRQEAEEYFRDRPNDFLVLEMESADAMAKLSEFLGIKDEGISLPSSNHSGTTDEWSRIEHPNKVMDRMHLIRYRVKRLLGR